LLLNSLVYILVHSTHQPFITRHLFTEPQLYQVKQVPREFDTQYSLTVLYYLSNLVHLPAVKHLLSQNSLYANISLKASEIIVLAPVQPHEVVSVVEWVRYDYEHSQYKAYKAFPYDVIMALDIPQ